MKKPHKLGLFFMSYNSSVKYVTYYIYLYICVVNILYTLPSFHPLL